MLSTPGTYGSFDYFNRRLNFVLFIPTSQVVSLQVDLIDPDDLYLIGVESLIALGVLVALVIAYLILSRHEKIAKGWNFVVFGLLFILIHSIFDVLDTLQWDDIVVDVLNVGDGITFLIGLLLFAIGLYRIAEFGAKQWEVK